MAANVVSSRASTRPTWAEVSLGNLVHNFRRLQQHVGSAGVCAVVKADAYGHGAVACALALEQAGARWFGVTTTDEALPLREAGVLGRIVLMTGFWRGEEADVVRQNLTAIVWEPEHLALLERAAAAQGVRAVPVHLKVDSGMGRLGAAPERLPALLAALQSSSHLKLEGLCTHFASSEIVDAPEMERQTECFSAAERLVREAGFSPEIFHLANTAAIASRPDSWRTMVRPGLGLYGYCLPLQRVGSPEQAASAAPDLKLDLKLDLKPVLSWKTRILSLHDAQPGQALGYGGTFVVQAPARIAVLPVGYADGLVRKLSNRGRVIVRERYAPMVGRISMDLTLVDVTGMADVAAGDEVILIGSSGACAIDAWEQARLAETLPYEILCGISKRVPRKYMEGS